MITDEFPEEVSTEGGKQIGSQGHEKRKSKDLETTQGGPGHCGILKGENQGLQDGEGHPCGKYHVGKGAQ